MGRWEGMKVRNYEGEKVGRFLYPPAFSISHLQSFGTTKKESVLIIKKNNTHVLTRTQVIQILDFYFVKGN